MTEQQLHDYQSHIRGAATWILLGKTEDSINAAEIARLYSADLGTVTADINAIVDSEHAKVGGVFETRVPLIKQTLASQMPPEAGISSD